MSDVGLGQGVFTTGQIADLCRVAARTVSKWFDSGKLKGYRIPGSNDRRVPREAVLEFLHENQMPIPESLVEARSVVCLGLDLREAEAVAAVGVETTIVQTPLAAGVLLGRKPCGSLVASLGGLGTSEAARLAAAECRALVLVLPEDAPEDLDCGPWQAVVRQPIGPAALALVVKAALAAPPAPRGSDRKAGKCIRCGKAFTPISQYQKLCGRNRSCVTDLKRRLASALGEEAAHA